MPSKLLDLATYASGAIEGLQHFRVYFKTLATLEELLLSTFLPFLRAIFIKKPAVMFGASFGCLSPSIGQRLRRATRHVVILVCGAAEDGIGLGDQPLDAFVDVFAVRQDTLGSRKCRHCQHSRRPSGASEFQQSEVGCNDDEVSCEMMMRSAMVTAVRHVGPGSA